MSRFTQSDQCLLTLAPFPSSFSRRGASGLPGLNTLTLRCYLLMFCLALIGQFACASETPGLNIHIEQLRDVPYDLAREALEEAIAEEGLAAPVVSHFADMLTRTAKDLGHSDTLYRHAHIYTFCTVAAAAQLATENPDFIALCPLSIAIYQLPGDDGIRLAYQTTGLSSHGGDMASSTQARIVQRTLSILGLQ